MSAAETNLSKDALYEIARSLADRGEDYGWNVYYKGSKISKRDETLMLETDENAACWLEAFRWSIKTYRTATGEDWSY